MVRIGAALYGINPQSSGANPLKNVIKLALPILQIRTTDSEASVGYGAESFIKSNTKLAVVAGGYADGVHRTLGLKPQGLIGDSLVKSVGRISMDSIVFDITECGQSNPEFIEVVNDQLSLDMLMIANKSLGYEVLTSLGQRYKRQYILADI